MTFPASNRHRTEWLILGSALLLLGFLLSLFLYWEHQLIESNQREHLTNQAQLICNVLTPPLESSNSDHLNLRHETWMAAGFFIIVSCLCLSVLYYTQHLRLKSKIENNHAAAALKHKIEELEGFFSTSLDLLCIADFQGKFCKLNPAWEQTLGYTLAELHNIHFLDLIHPDDVVATQKIMKQLVEGNPVTCFTNRYRTSRGEYLFIEWHSVPYPEHGLIYAAARDITEHLEIQSSLAEKERFLRTLIDIIPGMVGYWDTNLRNKFANIAYLEWFNKTSEQMKGIYIQELMGNTLFKENEPFIRAALNGISQDFERTLKKSDGTTGYTWAHYIPDIVNNQVQGFFVLVSDITELKKAQLNLEKSNHTLSQRTADAEAANRAKSAFLANMSHEIRTPINAVLGFLQLLQFTKLSTQQIDYIKKAQDATQFLLVILNDILDFSKIEAGKLELEDAEFSLSNLMKNLSVILSAALTSKDVEVLFRIDPDIPTTLRGDALRLQQILLNLAGNAIKFTPSGEVILELNLVETKPNIVRIKFSVNDTGIGIPPDRLTAIFQGFTQAETSTTQRYGGTGLGLAISQRLVRLMGSELFVYSTPGQGSHFYFTIDLGKVDAEIAIDNFTEIEPYIPSEKLRVLVVDDNAVAREVLSEIINSFGWEVETSASGIQAINLLTQNAIRHQKPFDIICMDWLMPGMDGLETVQHIRGMHQGEKEQVILMVTSHGRKLLSENFVIDADLLDGLLVKPVTPSMLFNAIAQATGGRSITLDRQAMQSLSSQKTLLGLRILVVEDNLLNQQVAQELLTHAGAEVEVASDGQSGIEIIQNTHYPFDVVLMDIQMPRIDGYQVAHILRTQLKVTLPIIAMTANAMPSDHLACLKAGMNDHISKPIHITDLIQTVLRHCSHKIHVANYLQNQPSQPLSQSLLKLPLDFDLLGALTRLDNDKFLYSTLARCFDADQGQAILRIRHYLQQGDHINASRTLHILKGVAATLGAQKLAKLAEQMENQIQTSPLCQEDSFLLEQLDLCLTETKSLLQHIADDLDPPSSSDSLKLK